MTTTRDLSAEARDLPWEPTARWILVLVAVTVAAWLGVLAWQVQVLPERVPTHFGSGGEADSWSSRSAALAFSVLVPLLVALPMPLLSRLALRWPSSINVPNREWWTATAPRVRRFERLLREDLWLFAVLTMSLLVAMQAGIVLAATGPDAQMPPGLLAGSLVVFTAGMIAVLARMFGGRYAEQPELV